MLAHYNTDTLIDELCIYETKVSEKISRQEMWTEYGWVLTGQSARHTP